MSELPNPSPFPGTTQPEEPEVVVKSFDLIGRHTEAQTRRLHRFAMFAVAALGVVLAVTADVEDVLHLYLGLTIYFLSLWPALQWLKEGGSRFPIFEPILALCANAYAMPVLSGHSILSHYPVETITYASLAIIVYQVSAIATYTLTTGRPGRARFWSEPILNHKVEAFVSYGIVLSAAHAAIAEFTTWIPFELFSVLRAAFYGVSVLCTFVTTQRWGRGELKQNERWFFGSLLLFQLIIMASGLLLINAITMVGIAMLGYLSGGRRFPWTLAIVCFACVAVLHNGKSQMRALYWEGERPKPGLLQLPGFFAEWIGYGFSSPVLVAPEEGGATAGAKLVDRASLMHIFAMVVHFTPQHQPFLMGETYNYVLPQLIPRIFWQGKPRSHIATYRLSIYYGLQDEESTTKTTIAFGMPAEAYANFGMFGMILLGGFFGFALKKLRMLSSNSPMFSLAGMLMILLTAWSFNAELTLAAWVSSLSQGLIMALGVPWALRQVLGD